jgi:hypothetical protein
MAAGHGLLRASHDDREHVIDTLKAAFVQGRLSKDELDVRVGETLASRTYAELAALTADLPAWLSGAHPVRPPSPARPRAQVNSPSPAQPGAPVPSAAKLGAGVVIGPAVLVAAYFIDNELLFRWLITLVIVYWMALMVAGACSTPRTRSAPAGGCRRGQRSAAGRSQLAGRNRPRDGERGMSRPRSPCAARNRLPS